MAAFGVTPFTFPKKPIEVTMPPTKAITVTLPTRADLAHDLFMRMREWRMTSCTIQQQREFLEVMRLLKGEMKR